MRDASGTHESTAKDAAAGERGEADAEAAKAGKEVNKAKCAAFLFDRIGWSRLSGSTKAHTRGPAHVTRGEKLRERVIGIFARVHGTRTLRRERDGQRAIADGHDWHTALLPAWW